LARWHCADLPDELWRNLKHDGYIADGAPVDP